MSIIWKSFLSIWSDEKNGTEMLVSKYENWMNPGKSLGEGNCLKEEKRTDVEMVTVFFTSSAYFDYAL